MTSDEISSRSADVWRIWIGFSLKPWVRWSDGTLRRLRGLGQEWSIMCLVNNENITEPEKESCKMKLVQVVEVVYF